MSYRKPPKPLSYDTAPKGTCRYCGEHIIDTNGNRNKRAHWHIGCVEQYKLIYWPKETKKAVFHRDRSRCAKCQKRDPRGWEMDHIVPLIEAKGDIDFWKLDNLQTLCSLCHTEKTVEENKARAAAKRALKSLHTSDD